MKATERDLRRRIATLRSVIDALQEVNARLGQELAIAEERISNGVTKQLLLMERLIEADEKIKQLTQSKKTAR